MTITCRIGAGTLFLFVLIFLGLDSAKSESSPRVILEVINKHFTVGRRIPSVYLRVFSNGTTVDEAAEAEWNQEIARRIEDLDSGKAKTVPWEVVRSRISSKLTE